MARNFVALLVLVAVVALCHQAESIPAAKARKERPGFIFLGSTKKEVKVQINGVESSTFEDHNYWMSVNAAGYAEASKDCRANTDKLVEIETAEELELVEAFLQDTDQTVSLAWVGAKYQVRDAKFTWEGGDDILDNFWLAGQPSQSKPNSRVAAALAGQIVQLKSQAATQVARYICESL